MDFQGYVLSLKIDKENLPTGYPFNIPCLNSFESLNFHPSVTYFTGENGVGKSTLIEALATYLGFNPEGGSRNFNFATRASHSQLYKYLNIAKSVSQIQDGFFLRSESFYNVATEVDALDKSGASFLHHYGGISLHEQSHGESFWALFNNRFWGNGIYILDEPESALSITRQMAMLSRIHSLTKKKSQFIIVTHSPILLAYPDSIIYEMTSQNISKIKYEESDIYRSYKGFLDDYKKSLAILLDEE